MDFKLSVWSRAYYQVQALGEIYKDSLPHYKWDDDREQWDKIPPPKPLCRDDQLDLQLKIDEIIAKISNYLDSCGMPRILRAKKDGKLCLLE